MSVGRVGGQTIVYARLRGRGSRCFEGYFDLLFPLRGTGGFIFVERLHWCCTAREDFEFVFVALCAPLKEVVRPLGTDATEPRKITELCVLCRRHIDGISFGDGRRAGPVAPHFPIYDVDAHFCGLAVVLIEQRGVFLYREIDYHRVAVHTRLVKLPFGKVSLQHISRYLVEVDGIRQLLYDEGLTLHINRVERGVIGVDIDFFAQNLSVVAPCDGISVKRQLTKFGMEDE